MSAHTPAPWFIPPHAAQTLLHVYARGTVISGVVCTVNTGWPHADQQAEQRANARLITAAPDLLAALEELVAIVENALTDDGAHLALRGLMDSFTCQPACAAITKATGATP